MDIITIDFETYYSKEFSLSKMTTESYIRDPRFQIIGVSAKVNDGPIEWITGETPIIRRRLKELNLDNNAVLCHNTAFDGAILSWVLDIHPKFLLDTLSMARPHTGLTVGGSLRALAVQYNLGEKGTEIYNTLGKRREDFTDEELEAFGEYCRQDVNLTWKLYQVLLPLTPPKELYLINLCLRMFTEPKLLLDKPRLEAHLANVREKKAELMAKVTADRTEIMSNPRFAELLKAEGVEPPMKVSPTTGKQTYAFAKTDEAFKALLDHPNENVQALVACRLGCKSTIEETRTESLIGVAERGPLPIMLNYYGGATGRACLTGDTVIMVFRDGEVTHISLENLQPDDLVWDGEEFVEHEGLIDQGVREVISYQGLTGTKDHRVFVEDEDEPVELELAMLRGLVIRAAEIR